MTPPTIARLVLDAQEQVSRAIAHVPAPGRGGRLGRLNTLGWMVAHTASTHDAWLNAWTQGLERDPWCDDWYARSREAGWDRPIEVNLAGAIEAWERVCTRTSPFLESLDPADLSREFEVPGPWKRGWVGQMVTRSVAHLFAHAGEMTVLASLVRAGDLGLPGGLKRTYEALDDETLEGARWALALARDAREQFERVARGTPRPALGQLFVPRLSSGAGVVVHIASGQDVAWNEMAQGLDRDPWLDAVELQLDREPGTPEPPIDADQALEAYGRVVDRNEGYLGTIEGGDMPPRALGGLGWTAAHLFSHAGELAAIASLVGAPDFDLPGDMRHTGALAARGGVE